jgi:hypothetical protein
MELSIVQIYEYSAIAVISSLVCYRVTRLITSDLLFEDIRNSLIVFISQKKTGGFHNGLRGKIAYLIGCEVCVGTWISALLTIVLQYSYGFDSSTSLIFFWFTVSAIQYLISGKFND